MFQMNFDTETSDEISDLLTIKPLGSGQEVGRSCHYLTFKGKKILLDCGIHPGMSGVDALPFVDHIDCDQLDLLLVTHFHLDHCGAVPWLLEKTAFRGRCFMTHATKAIYRMLIGDSLKVSKYGSGGDSRMLYTEEDLEKSMEKIEVIDFHEQKEVNGIKFWCYVAGHVLGACMFMIEIAGVRILYTGDFSRLEDRHLCAAELPTISPEVLICESTYGTQLHESREEREKRFTSTVHEIVGRGGRCLIPAFALGRAQELLLILDEYWEAHPELQDIPVYYASSLAKKCMAVYQTFVSGMNSRIQKQIALNNPFVFKHVSNLKSIEHFEDVGPCVVLASPGMLQNGLSRELFESWCTDTKNGCIIAGYCVEGTPAKYILSDPEEIVAMNGQKLAMRLQVAYISFSAHTDYGQTSDFVHSLRPQHLVLVHGEMNEMNRLKAAIIRQYEDNPDHQIEVHNPKNTEAIELHFRGEKTAKVVGKMATVPPKDGDVLSGVIVRRNFNYHFMVADDLSGYAFFHGIMYSELSNSVLTQKESLYYDGTVRLLLHNLQQVAGDVSMTEIDSKDPLDPNYIMKLFDDSISLQLFLSQHAVVIEWTSNPVNDMFADAAIAAVLHAQTNPVPDKNLGTWDQKPDTVLCLKKALSEICGETGVIRINGDVIELEVDGKTACIEVANLRITCTDQLLHHLVSSVCQKMMHTLSPICASKLK
uniref:Cleavage and polyadenylation specificity factor subunit 3 n=1 Tax=Syphacia muris TaxID=451379 RepID=A0A0N5AE44_9BILA